jgi:hypothetical protein
LYFEPGTQVVQDFKVWSMEADIRRNMGYAVIVILRSLGEDHPLVWREVEQKKNPALGERD